MKKATKKAQRGEREMEVMVVDVYVGLGFAMRPLLAPWRYDEFVGLCPLTLPFEK